MTPHEFKHHLLAKARQDVNRALDMAIEQLAITDHCVSSGFVRAKPYRAVRPAQEPAPSIEDPDTSVQTQAPDTD